VTLRAFKKMPLSDEVFTILDEAMREVEPDVKKAVAWIPREITKNDKEAVSRFLRKWAEQTVNKHTWWIIKEGMKKLPSSEQEEILSLLKEGRSGHS
jgi:3-methyladenine DNA glycosylase AlkC